MTWRITALLIVLLTAAFPSRGREPETFQAGVSYVDLDVQVLDDGRPVTGLHGVDFVVLDERQRQQLTYAGQESDPLRLALVLDMSGSVARYRRLMAESAEKALAMLKPGDKAAILLYGRTTALYIEMTSDPHDLLRGIQTAEWSDQLGSGTSTNQAIVQAATYLRECAAKESGANVHVRNTVLVLTDNRGLNYQTPDVKVLQELSRAGAVLNAIVVGRAKRPKPPKDSERLNPDFTPTNVFLLADKTGGEAIASENVDEVFPDLLERIRSRYLLLYRAPDAASGTYRRVSVQLAPAAQERWKKARIQVREGYYVP